jgi:Methyl-accepting chemotaxis protein (MCP) signalling domain
MKERTAVLKIYSIARFLITTFLLGALAWFGFMTLDKFQTRYLDTLNPAEELIRIIKDGQISLEKYRQFGQVAQLEDVTKSVGLAETKLNIFSKSAQSGTAKGKTPVKFVAIDSLNKSIKSQKEIIDTLKLLHQEEDLSAASISGIGNLRIEMEKAVNFAIALRKSSLAEIGVQGGKVLSQLKFNLLVVLGLALILYLVEIIWLFLALRVKRTVSKATVEAAPSLNEGPMQTNQLSSEIPEEEDENADSAAEAMSGGEPQPAEVVDPVAQPVGNLEAGSVVEASAKESLIEPAVKPELEINVAEAQKPEIVEPNDVNLTQPTATISDPPVVEPTFEVRAKPLFDLIPLQLNFRKIEETVDDINERISLMAFNALLEAARAGEAGKGFQIVGEELRRIADRSTKSAGEIKELFEEISNQLSHVTTT